MPTTVYIVALSVLLGPAATTGAQEEAPRVLFLSKSTAFEHPSIARKDGNPSHVEKVLMGLAKDGGAELTCTKDAGLINAENLKNYDLVIFYTQGDLTKSGLDGQTPMGENGVRDLIEWIERGGGFMGFHCASDTFRTPRGEKPSPYIDLIGGEFRFHGAQFKSTVKVVDPGHPAMANAPDNWEVFDEWYLFRNLNEEKIHVLALCEPGGEGDKQKLYNIPAWPITWCRGLGEGRIYYTALAHREDVWSDPVFQQTVLDAAGWVLGEGPLDADPNFEKTVPTEIGEFLGKE